MPKSLVFLALTVFRHHKNTDNKLSADAEIARHVSRWKQRLLLTKCKTPHFPYPTGLSRQNSGSQDSARRQPRHRSILSCTDVHFSLQYEIKIHQRYRRTHAYVMLIVAQKMTPARLNKLLISFSELNRYQIVRSQFGEDLTNAPQHGPVHVILATMTLAVKSGQVNTHWNAVRLKTEGQRRY